MNSPGWVARHPALQALLELATEEARERVHELLEPAHLVLALTRQEGEAADLIRRAGAEPRTWRDYVNYVLGLNLACSAGAQVLGHGCLAQFGPEPEERPVRLLGWLGGLIIQPHCSGQAPRELLRRTLAAFPGSAGLGIAHRGAVVLSSGWKEVEEVATGWDGGSLILASEKSRPRWLTAGRHPLPRAAARHLQSRWRDFLPADRYPDGFAGVLLTTAGARGARAGEAVGEGEDRWKSSTGRTPAGGAWRGSWRAGSCAAFPGGSRVS